MILCMGEALIDLVPEPGGTLRPLAGGAVYNTAVALCRPGAPPGFLWPISRDGFADLLLRPLIEARVDTAACPRSERPTTLAVVSLAQGDARYSFYDEGSAGRMFSASDLPPLAPGLLALFIGGISLVSEPCGSTVEAFARQAAAQGIPVMLDPNIRPFFVSAEAAYRARLDRLFGLAAIVKLSAEDCDWLWPGAAPDEIAQELLAKGARLVLMTRGAQGAVALTTRHRVQVPAPRVTVADTIGAGDTFNAGILDALCRAGALDRLGDLDEPTLAAALDHASRAAAVTVSRPGANPPWTHEL